MGVNHKDKRTSSQWLDIDGGVNVFFRRDSAFGTRHNRRIHRQNLPRNQTASAIFYRRNRGVRFMLKLRF